MFAKAKKVMTEDEAYYKLSSLCAAAEYCETDMRKKMSRWELPDGAEDRLINKLVSERFIDESRFAMAFVREKFRFNHWGKVKISIELKRRGISQMVIDESLDEIHEDDNHDTLLSLLMSKKKSVKGKTDTEIKFKLMRFALSRGFTIDDIERVIDTVIK